MTDATRAQALTKLDSVTIKVGYPDVWRDYSALRLAAAEPFLGNVARASAFEANRQLRKLGRPVDRREWGMTPPTVNAYSNARFVEIVFPAGILQPPFVDPLADDAALYGAVGGVIGHELTHEFDDQGRKFDAQGNQRDWWTAADAEQFDRRAQLVVDQYAGFTVGDSLHLNGKLTLGENLGDIGGLTIAYDAWRRSLAGKPRPPAVDGFTPEQRFFIAWASIWRRKTRPEAERTQVLTDPHSPARYRVNGVVAHMPAFKEAFGCKDGDPMVLPADRRLAIW
jgi:putative endopeptidase